MRIVYLGNMYGLIVSDCMEMGGGIEYIKNPTTTLVVVGLKLLIISNNGLYD